MMKRHGLTALALIAALAVIVLRLAGPSDLWNQTQPKTVTYTTSLVAADAPAQVSWALPIGPRNEPATKPPLYNWIAAPAVAWLGTDCEFAHRLPSILSFVAMVGMILWVGSRFGDPRTGAFAVLAFSSCYMTFKLSVLVRPDTLLTAFLALGWISATTLLLAAPADRGQRRYAALFWFSVAGALLAKGPAAALPLLFVVVGAPILGGGWRSLRRFSLPIGLPLALLPAVLWLWLAWRTDGDHVRNVLWGEEIWGRITGTGTEGGGEGWRGIFLELANLPAGFMTRAAPWSGAAAAAAVALIWRIGPATVRTSAGRWASAALLYIAIVIGVFSLSSGKRPDYIASTVLPGALLATWWMLGAAPGERPPLRRPALFIPATAFTMIAAMTAVASRDFAAPMPQFGDRITAFAQETRATIATAPGAVRCCWTGSSPYKALVGIARPEEIARHIARDSISGEAFWVIAGRRWRDGARLEQYLAELGIEHRLELVLDGPILTPGDGWPGGMSLYRSHPKKP